MGQKKISKAEERRERARIRNAAKREESERERNQKAKSKSEDGSEHSFEDRKQTEEDDEKLADFKSLSQLSELCELQLVKTQIVTHNNPERRDSKEEETEDEEISVVSSGKAEAVSVASSAALSEQIEHSPKPIHVTKKEKKISKKQKKAKK